MPVIALFILNNTVKCKHRKHHTEQASLVCKIRCSLVLVKFIGSIYIFMRWRRLHKIGQVQLAIIKWPRSGLSNNMRLWYAPNHGCCWNVEICLRRLVGRAQLTNLNSYQNQIINMNLILVLIISSVLSQPLFQSRICHKDIFFVIFNFFFKSD